MTAGLLRITALGIFVFVTACSQSGSGDQNVQNKGTVQKEQILGVAAVGAPIVGGTVSAACANGSLANTTTKADGSFAIEIPLTVFPPCLLRVSGGTVRGGASPYVLHGFSEDQTESANVTPFTELAIAKAMQRVPANEFGRFTAGTAAAIQLNLTSADSYVRTELATVPGVTVPSVDFFTGRLQIGDAHDKALEALMAALFAGGHTIAELTVYATAGQHFAPLVATPTPPPAPATPQWGTLTISGIALPPDYKSKFTPNFLPTTNTGQVIWRDVTYDSTNATPTVDHALIINLNPANGTVQNLALNSFTTRFVPSNGSIDCAIAGACNGISYNVATRTITFNSVPILLGAFQTTLAGSISYSDLPAGAGTTISAAGVGQCPSASTPTSSGEISFASGIGCLAGVLVGTSDYGLPCTLTIDTTVQSVRLKADDLDATTLFQIDNSAAKTNLFHAYATNATSAQHTYTMTDPLVGASAVYRTISISAVKFNSGPALVRVEANARSDGFSGKILSRGACSARL